MRLRMQPGEEILAQEGAQLARGFPQTAGEIYLTSHRLVLIPSQFMSMWCGELIEIPLERIRAIRMHGRFRGGTLIGGAGRKIEVVLDDGSRHTFSFFLNADVDRFHTLLEFRLAHAAPRGGSLPDGTRPAAEFPKPRRTVWFWLLIASTVVGTGLLVYAVARLIRRW